MSQYYQEFNQLLDSNLEQLIQQTKIDPSPEQMEKVKKACQTLWRYDLRRSISGDQNYPEIIRSIFNSITTNAPVQLIQFACTKRDPMTNYKSPETSIITSTEGSNLLPNLPFLKVIKGEFDILGIDSKIIVLLADSENYWVDFRQGSGLDYNILEALQPIWVKAYLNLVQTVNQTLGDSNILQIIPTSTLETSLKDTFDFEELFEKYKSQLYLKFPLKLLARMAIVWRNVAVGNQRSAFADAEEEVNSDRFKNENLSLQTLKDEVGEIFVDKAIRQLTEYPLQGWMLERLYPNCILLQNEKPFGSAEFAYRDGKNYFYNIDLSLRARRLPEISPYFYT